MVIEREHTCPKKYFAHGIDTDACEDVTLSADHRNSRELAAQCSRRTALSPGEHQRHKGRRVCVNVDMLGGKGGSYGRIKHLNTESVTDDDETRNKRHIAHHVGRCERQHPVSQLERNDYAEATRLHTS